MHSDRSICAATFLRFSGYEQTHLITTVRCKTNQEPLSISPVDRSARNSRSRDRLFDLYGCWQSGSHAVLSTATSPQIAESHDYFGVLVEGHGPFEIRNPSGRRPSRLGCGEPGRGAETLHRGDRSRRSSPNSNRRTGFKHDSRLG